jgi:hypothetical protein
MFHIIILIIMALCT